MSSEHQYKKKEEYSSSSASSSQPAASGFRQGETKVSVLQRVQQWTTANRFFFFVELCRMSVRSFVSRSRASLAHSHAHCVLHVHPPLACDASRALSVLARSHVASMSLQFRIFFLR
jgi:hypothetical protein